MVKESIEKICFGMLIGCLLTVSVLVAFSIYTDNVIDNITSKSDGVQSEMNITNYNYWADHELFYTHDPLSLEWQNETENLNDMEYINGEEILELKYSNSISINNLSFHGYALQLKIIPDNHTQKYYAYDHTETNPDENIIIGEPEYQEVTTQCLNLYLNISNCETLQNLLI